MSACSEGLILILLSNNNQKVKTSAVAKAHMCICNLLCILRGSWFLNVAIAANGECRKSGGLFIGALMIFFE